MNNTKIILFDSDCLMCNSFIQFAYKLNKNYKYSALNSQYSKSIILEYNLLKIDSIFFVDNNKIYYYSNAIIKILIRSEYLGCKILGFLFWTVPYPIRDLCYRLIANSRISLSFFFKNTYCNLDIAKQIIT
jgi:predicted DCC family thiol-disulfide oxidoreductase YuxK